MRKCDLPLLSQCVFSPVLIWLAIAGFSGAMAFGHSYFQVENQPQDESSRFRDELKTLGNLGDEAVKVLGSIVDRKNIFDNKRKLLTIEEAYQPVRASATKRMPLVSGEERQLLLEQIKGWNKYALKEYNRLHSANLVDDYSMVFPITLIDATFTKLAKGDINDLDFELESFQVEHDLIPTQLAALARKFGNVSARIVPERLIDPWGRPYQYEHTGSKNGGKKPDVWSLGPLRNQPKEQIIGNWK